MKTSSPFFGFKIAFLGLFGAVNLLFGVVGYVVSATMFLLMAWVIYAQSKQKPLEANTGPTEQTKEDKLEDEELDDLLLLEPLDEDEDED